MPLVDHPYSLRKARDKVQALTRAAWCLQRRDKTGRRDNLFKYVDVPGAEDLLQKILKRRLMVASQTGNFGWIFTDLCLVEYLWGTNSSLENRCKP